MHYPHHELEGLRGRSVGSLHPPRGTILPTHFEVSLSRAMSERRAKAEASAPRKRALVSCDRCKLRRARCIRDGPDEPCADCKTSGVQCENKLPRKQRVYGSVETLSLRYRALESLVKGLFPNENTQDTNVIFSIAAARNIPMPANDDYTPADIFNDDSQRPPFAQQQQPQNILQPTTQPHRQPRSSSQATSIHSMGTTSSASVSNPFAEAQQSSRQTEELIPTRNGASHYFGPSSSFRLATTIRALVSRFKATRPANITALQRSSSTQSERVTTGLRPTSTNPSEEEYVIPNIHGSHSPMHTGKKRSRSQMEGTDDQWENTEGRAHPGTIADLLPSRPLSDALVSAYFDHVHVHLPVFNRSMFLLKLEATYSRQAELLKECADIGWLICLAMVFSFGCQQLHEHDPDQAHILRLKYLSFVKTYFRRLLVTTSLANVQALVLLNVHHHIVGQKSSSWLLIGLGARMVSAYLPLTPT